jgi:tetratricopeptide (TPR) repeat protein
MARKATASERQKANHTRLGQTTVAVLAVLALAVVAVFANSLSNDFVFDDRDLVVTQSRIRDLSNWWNIFTESYRPLRTVTYAMDYALWGLDPRGYRITNIGIHVLNTWLVFFLGRRLFERAVAPALLAALFFALHPVQSESVAYISGRRDVLFAMFYLAGLLAWTYYRDAVAPRQRWLWLGATGALFGLSLAAKEMAASLPVACLLWDTRRVTQAGQSGERPGILAASNALVRQNLYLYSAAAAALAAFAYYTLVIRGATSKIAGTDVVYWGGSLVNNLLTVPINYAHYAGLAVFPRVLVAQYYGAYQPATGILDPRVIPSMILLGGLVALGFWLLARTRFAVTGFGILWFLATILPASQLIPHHEIVADHYLYLPIAGVGFALGELVEYARRLEGWRRSAALAASVLLLLGLSARTIARNADWKDEATLWRRTYEALPGSSRSAYNYAVVLTQRGEIEAAMRLFREAIELDPTFQPAYRNLASLLTQAGKYDEAREVWELALSQNLEEAARAWHMQPGVLALNYRVELAILDGQSGNTESCRDQLLEALHVYPDMLRAQDALMTVLVMRAEVSSTIDSLRTSLAANPNSVADNLIMANLLWRTGRQDQAIPYAEQARRLNPQSCLATLLVARYRVEVQKVDRRDSEVVKLFKHAREMALTPFDEETVESFRDGSVAPPPLRR